MKIGYAVGSIMTKEIVSVQAGAPLTQAIKTMVEKNIGSVVMTGDDSMVGIVTERDIMRPTLDVFKKLSDAWV
jgi:CBS domain-containing protein